MGMAGSGERPQGAGVRQAKQCEVALQPLPARSPLRPEGAFKSLKTRLLRVARAESPAIPLSFPLTCARSQE
jgi:hypothetical protein